MYNMHHHIQCSQSRGIWTTQSVSFSRCNVLLTFCWQLTKRSQKFTEAEMILATQFFHILGRANCNLNSVTILDEGWKGMEQFCHPDSTRLLEPLVNSCFHSLARKHALPCTKFSSCGCVRLEITNTQFQSSSTGTDLNWILLPAPLLLAT